MKKFCPTVLATVTLTVSFLTANLTVAEAQTNALPRAGFQTFTRPSQGPDAELPKINGVHLTPGMDRRKGEGVQPYEPGEPSLNMSLVRWDIRQFPLKVWISPGLKLPDVPIDVLQETRVDTVVALLKDAKQIEALPVAPGWKPEQNEMVAAGFEQWRELENEGLISFGFVDDPRQAQLLVFFTDRFQGAQGPGGTDVHGLTMGKVFSTEQVMEKSRRGEPGMPIVMELRLNEDFGKLQADSAHEFGHALGIKAHSPYREDIMYVNRIVDTISPADKATLRALYRHKPKYWYY